MSRRSARSAVALLGLLACPLPPAAATWSIIIVDTATKEVGVASATCLGNFDLRRGLPVVRVGKGAGCAQSFVDTTAANRQLIYSQLALGTAPETILQMLAAQDAQHQTRQYGMVDTQGRALTFSGSQNGAYAGGVTGAVGTLVYAIQGNVITGAAVIAEAENAVRTTPGRIPVRLMAAMQAARAMGGDGRCSCAPDDPTGCGAPPAGGFTHSAYVGFVIVARRGDTDGTCNTARGCASGIYYMNLNVATGNQNTGDPVVVLQNQFNAFRATRVGVPDALESRVTVTPDRLPNVSGARSMIEIELLDWQGQPAPLVDSVDIQLDPLETTGASPLGHIEYRGDGLYRATLDAGARIGSERLVISVREPFGTRVLAASPAVRIYLPADMNCDGDVNALDLDGFLLALLDPPAYAVEQPMCVIEAADVNLDGRVDFGDIEPFVACVLDGVCP